MMEFSNHDGRIRYYELMLEKNLDSNLDEPVCSELPEGYRFVFFKPGDRDSWIAIEKSAGEFESFEQGLEAWEKYYGGREAELAERMFFIENAGGEKIATASAMYDVFGKDQSGAGWLHWVAVRQEDQGRGLSKPLISRVIERLRELGYTRAVIPTQTTTWLACKIYLDFGFRPIRENAVHSRDGWRIVKALTNHSALAQFTPASLEEILKEEILKEEILKKEGDK